MYVYISSLVPQNLRVSLKAAEEKQKRKEAKKLAASAEDEAEEDAAGDIGVSTLVGTSRVKLVPVATSKATSVEDEDEAPALLNPDLPNLEAVVEKADVVIQLLDARDPLAYRSSHLEELVKAKSEKKLLFVLNKIGASLISQRTLTLLLKLY